MMNRICDFCNKVVPEDYYITIGNQTKCFDCCSEDTKSFVDNMCNCGMCNLTTPCNELTYYPALNTDICENCYNLLKEEDERNK